MTTFTQDDDPAQRPERVIGATPVESVCSANIAAKKRRVLNPLE